MNPKTFHCRRDELAQILGVNQQHISRLVAEGMPRVKHGVYSLPACVAWVTNRITRLGSLEPDHPGDIAVARRNLYLAQTKHKELQTRRLADELLDAVEVQENLSLLATMLLESLESLPERAAPDAATCPSQAEASAVLRQHCTAVRQELAERIGALGHSQRPARDAKPSGTANRHPEQRQGGAGAGR